MKLPQRNLIDKLEPEIVSKISEQYMPKEDQGNVPERILQMLIQVKTYFPKVFLVDWQQNGEMLMGIYRIGSCEPDALLGRDYFIYIFQSWAERGYNPDEERVFPPYPNLGNQVLCGFTGEIKLKKIWQTRVPKGIFNYVTGQYYENAEVLADDVIDYLFFDFSQMVLLMRYMFPKFAV